MPSFVPLGIADYSGNSERGFVQFTYQIADNNAKELTLQIRDGSLVIYEEKITDANKLKQGEHIWKWDGFDSGGILDTAKLTQYENLNLYTIGVDNSNNYSRKKLDFSMRYDEVKWVDVKIDKNSKRIDVTLRVNLKDGGARGVECKEVIHRDHLNPGMRTSKEVCPWDKIPQKTLSDYGKIPIKSITKSFEDLEKLALEGLNYHWGRNRNHYIAKDVDIDGEKYEVYVNAINTTQKTMDDVSLIFNTNNSWMRSGNPGTVEDPISYAGNIFSREAICYNVGYIKYSKKWAYQRIGNEDVQFKDTSAHEIGHTILKAYGGTFYSYGHKGSVNTVFQFRKSSAPRIPLEGEIDIMPYYRENELGEWYNQPNYHKRRVASTKDVLSLIWLTKIKLK